MKVFLAIRTVLGRSALALCCVFLLMKGGATFAQTTDTANSTPAESAAKEDVPSGGCMPMGLTASGEMVFPLQCKEFIERARGKTVEQRPVAPEDKPAAAPTSGKRADKPVDPDKPAETGSLPERVEHQNRVKNSDDCTHYRTYDPASGAYKGYDGRRRPCLARESNWRK
jgi:hypothetical protein